VDEGWLAVFVYAVPFKVWLLLILVIAAVLLIAVYARLAVRGAKKAWRNRRGRK
jgi:hypothetical protein